MILICDDDRDFTTTLEKIFQMKRFTAKVFSNGSELLSFIEELEDLSGDILLLDVNMPNLNGLDVLKEIKSQRKNLTTIMLTGENDIPLAVDCMKNGAKDYITKPFNQGQLIEIISGISKIKEETSIRSSNIEESLEKFVGKNITIHLSGESGTGKEYYAKKYWKLYNDPKIPFVPVNCPAITDSLAESELFGHEKGSFTGADRQKLGKLEMANNGILFLDEVADLSLEIQAKLLRVLEEREIERVGGNERIPVNFKIISASSKDLKKEIEAGRFRSDLYYRIADMELKIPSLRDRSEEIEKITNILSREISMDLGVEEALIDYEVFELIKCYRWPGNIRELKSFLKKMYVFSDGQTISKDNVPLDLLNLLSVDNSPVTSMKAIEKNRFIDSYKKNKKDTSKIAVELGLSRATVYRRIKEYNL